MRNFDFFNFFKSMLFFFKSLFIKHHYDVVFVYLNHFNRGKNGENLFLQPMIESCKRHNIKYIVFEDTDLKGEFSKYPRNKEAIPLDFITMLRILFRKIYGKKHLISDINDLYFRRENLFSNIMKKTFFRNIDFDICINMAGDNLTLFRGLNSKALVCEYQHGIIYNGHYVIDGKPTDYILKNKAIFLLFGKGFQSLLIDFDSTGYYKENTEVIGINNKLVKHKKVIKKNKKIILFSLQITPDHNYQELENYVKIVQNIIQDNANFLGKHGYEIIFKHHPRFDEYKSPNIKLDQSFVQLIDDIPLDELLDKSSIHMTFYSTTTFEAAMKGIPTIFIDMYNVFSPYDIYFNQYKYPLDKLRITNSFELKIILESLENPLEYEKNCKAVFDWAKSFYSAYDEKNFLDFVNQKEHSNEY